MQKAMLCGDCGPWRLVRDNNNYIYISICASFFSHLHDLHRRQCSRYSRQSVSRSLGLPWPYWLYAIIQYTVV